MRQRAAGRRTPPRRAATTREWPSSRSSRAARCTRCRWRARNSRTSRCRPNSRRTSGSRRPFARRASSPLRVYPQRHRMPAVVQAPAWTTPPGWHPERRPAMRIVRSSVSCAVVLLIGSNASADKIKGFLWEASPSAIVVDGQKVALSSDTRVERPNQKDITTRDLHVGWEVEVEAREGDTGWVARVVRVKDARFQEEEILGVIDGLTPKTFLVDGDEIHVPKGA